jgi:hypothetical protein
MNYEFTQGLAKDIFIPLYSLGTGLPKSGIVSANIVVKFVKSNGISFTTKVITTGLYGNFAEIGDGLYKLGFEAEETDVLGNLGISIVDSSIYGDVEPKLIIAEVKPSQVLAKQGPPTCRVFGDIKRLVGVAAIKPYEVNIQLVALPKFANGSLLAVTPERVYSNLDGLFEIDLAIGALVILEIPDTGFRRQFTVPNQASIDVENL